MKAVLFDYQLKERNPRDKRKNESSQGQDSTEANYRCQFENRRPERGKSASGDEASSLERTCPRDQLTPTAVSTCTFLRNSAASSGITVLMNIPEPRSNPAVRVSRGITLIYQWK